VPAWAALARATLCKSIRSPPSDMPGWVGSATPMRPAPRRMMPPCGSDVSCIAFTTGTAVFAVLHWLLELRCAPAPARAASGLCLHQCV